MWLLKLTKPKETLTSKVKASNQALGVQIPIFHKHINKNVVVMHSYMCKTILGENQKLDETLTNNSLWHSNKNCILALGKDGREEQM